MITDRLTTFCLATALNTGAAGDYIIGDWIDLQNVRDLGQGQDAYLVMQVDTAATSGGSATLQLGLVSNDASPLLASGANTHLLSSVFALASLTTGKSLFVGCLPYEGPAYKRYLGIRQTTGVAAFTAGKVDAFLTFDPAVWKAYADAQN